MSPTQGPPHAFHQGLRGLPVSLSCFFLFMHAVIFHLYRRAELSGNTTLMQLSASQRSTPAECEEVEIVCLPLSAAARLIEIVDMETMQLDGEAG